MARHPHSRSSAVFSLVSLECNITWNSDVECEENFGKPVRARACEVLALAAQCSVQWRAFGEPSVTTARIDCAGHRNAGLLGRHRGHLAGLQSPRAAVRLRQLAGPIDRSRLQLHTATGSRCCAPAYRRRATKQQGFPLCAPSLLLCQLTTAPAESFFPPLFCFLRLLLLWDCAMWAS